MNREVRAKSGSSHFDGLGSVLLALQWLLLLCLLPVFAQAADAPIYRQVIKTFHNDNYYTKGLPAAETVADGAGRVFSETTNTYTLKDVDVMTQHFLHRSGR